MAQKVNIVLVDDIDESEAVETVTFGLDGTSYEIDLNKKHAAALRDAVSFYVGHARKVTGAARGRRGSAKTSAGPLGARGARLGPLQRSPGPRPGPDPG